MWNKRDEEPARPSVPPPSAAASVAPPPSAGERREAAGIGPSIRIVGDVSGDEDLTILGRVEGRIVLPKHSVTIGQGGHVKADIQAKFVSVAGEVHGNLTAGEQIVIRKTATMLGNLTAPRVGLEDGCRFRGSVEMETPAASAGVPPMTGGASGEKGRVGAAPGSGLPGSAQLGPAPPKPLAQT
jgi:cytoskeletal protein CcmA (bactofilin family)